jgi:hypothetical protein
MSTTRNMAGAMALLASSLLGVGCATGTDDIRDDADNQSISANDATTVDKEATGESRQATWGYGYPGYGYPGYGYPGYGYPVYPQPVYPTPVYPAPVYVYPGYGYPSYGYPGYGYPGYGWGHGWRRGWR